jgi:hypothetical protein
VGRKKVSEGGTVSGHQWQKGEVTNPKGRPSGFSEELGERIIDAMWSGECKSLIDVAAFDWAPTRKTIHNWKERYPEFGAELSKAQTALGEVLVHHNQKIVADMLAGTVDPSAANVAIRSNQWTAQALDNFTYGNKSYVKKDELKRVEHIFTDRIPVEDMTDEELDALESGLMKAKLLLTGPPDGI